MAVYLDTSNGIHNIHAIKHLAKNSMPPVDGTICAIQIGIAAVFLIQLFNFFRQLIRVKRRSVLRPKLFLILFPGLIQSRLVLRPILLIKSQPENALAGA